MFVKGDFKTLYYNYLLLIINNLMLIYVWY